MFGSVLYEKNTVILKIIRKKYNHPFFNTKMIQTWDYRYPINLIFCMDDVLCEPYNVNGSDYRSGFKHGPNGLDSTIRSRLGLGISRSQNKKGALEFKML